MMRYFASLLVLPLLLLAPAGGEPPPQADVTFEEWAVPWEGSRPRDPYVDGKGRVWFVGQAGNYIAYLEPSSGEFRRYEIEDGTHPHNLIIDESGMVWYAGNRNGRIGRLDPNTGEAKIHMMPDEAARDPHTLIFDNDGNIWFTVQGGNRVGHLNVTSGAIRLVESPHEGSRPYGIVVDSQNRPWLNLFGTHMIATVDPVTFELRTHALPREGARTRRIELTSNDDVWWVDYAEGYVGRFRPSTGEHAEWRSPSGAESRPYAMAVDDQDRVWYVESGVNPNRFVGFDPRTERFVANAPIDSRTIRHMVFHAPTREIWFGTDAGTIGRARIP